MKLSEKLRQAEASRDFDGGDMLRWADEAREYEEERVAWSKGHSELTHEYNQLAQRLADATTRIAELADNARLAQQLDQERESRRMTRQALNESLDTCRVLEAEIQQARAMEQRLGEMLAEDKDMYAWDEIQAAIKGAPRDT